MSDNVKNTKRQNGVWGDVLTKEMVEKQAVEELPAVQMEMPKYKEESPEEVAFAIAPFDVWTTAGWINVLNELNQMGYVICKRVNEE